MKIAIDATPWMPQPSGMGFYVANLIRALNDLQSAESFDLELIYQPRLQHWLKGDLSLPNHLQPYSNQIRRFPVPVRVSNLWIKFPRSLSSFESFFAVSDIFHGTNYTVFPLKKSRRVMTLYDLTFIKYPQYANATVKAYAHRVKQCLKWTDLVLTISEHSKQDICRYLRVDPSRVWVTPLASRYQTDNSITESETMHSDQPYILFVSTIEPRKNITTLIDAFDDLKQKYQLDHQLVLIGQKGWLYQPIFERIARSPFHRSIHHLSYLSDQLVAQYYANADVFVYPSYYEGFGMPVLEAMTLGAPVITSNVSSLPEVAGDAAILVDPSDRSALAESILNVISDRELRNQLIQKGHDRALLYSWENTAKETLKAYRFLAG